MEKTLWIKTACAALGGMVSALFGQPDALLYALLFAVCADYITGLFAAAYEKKLSSRTGFRGIMKKIVILILVALSYRIGQTIGITELRDMVCGFYIANESLSVLENASRMDIPCTKKLKHVLEQLQKE